MLFSQVLYNRRLAQVACAIFWCLLSGGPIFGFAALKPVLVNQHVYEHLCDVLLEPVPMTTPAVGGMFTALVSALGGKHSGVAKCTDQDLKLNFMFTFAAVLTNMLSLAIGFILDAYGPRACGLIGSAFLFISCFIFIGADSILWFDPYLVGYGAMALGGPFAYILSFQLLNAFPEKSGTVLALLTGAFDALLAVFLLYLLAYKKMEEQFLLASFFKFYLAVPVFITVVQVFLMESELYKSAPAPELLSAPTESTGLLAPASAVRRRLSIGDAIVMPYAEEGETKLLQLLGGVYGVLHGKSALAQVATWWFVLMCGFTTIQMLRLNYFVATVRLQYTYLFGLLEQAEKLNKFFDLALPLGGVVSIPIVGYVLDTYSTVTVLGLLLSVSLSIGLLGLFGFFTTGVLNVALFVAYRPFFYTTVSDFCAKVFGFDTFGTVYGSIMCFAGAFNFMAGYLDTLTHTTFNMNPMPVNSVLLATTAAIGVATVGYVAAKAHAMKATVA